MSAPAILGYTLAGAILTNGVPHFVKGITGQRHITLIERSSSAPFNAVYGAANFAIGYALLRLLDENCGDVDPTIKQLAVALGGVAMAATLGAFFSRPDAKFPWQE